MQSREENESGSTNEPYSKDVDDAGQSKATSLSEDFDNPYGEASTTELQTRTDDEILLDELKLNGFEYIKDVSSGITGSVSLYRYHGDDDIIKRLLDENNLLIVKMLKTMDYCTSQLPVGKHAAKTFENECELISNVLSKYDSPHIPKAHVLDLNVRGYVKQVILNQCVFQNKEKQHSQDLKHYFTNLGQHCTLLNASKMVHELMKKITGMYVALNAVHEAGLLHLDALPRNFVLDENGQVKIIDFGLSAQIGDEGRAVKCPIFIFIPRLSYNSLALSPAQHGQKDNRSIFTDLFAFRVAVIEALGRFMGLTQKSMAEEIYCKGLTYQVKKKVKKKYDPRLTQSTKLPNQKKFEIVMRKVSSVNHLQHVSDVDRLSFAFENAKAYAKRLSDNKDYRGDVVAQVLAKMEKYLVSVPGGMEAEMRVIEVIEADKTMLETCAQINLPSFSASKFSQFEASKNNNNNNNNIEQGVEGLTLNNSI